ncbi:MAG: SGNH/GDSL hydrolase family protein [Planctomycetota bacterium]
MMDMFLCRVLGRVVIAVALFTAALAASAAEAIHARRGLPNFCRALADGKQVRIVYLGGGIAQGLGASNKSQCYAAALTRAWRKEFPKASLAEYICGIAGTGSWLGAFRTTDDVTRHYIQLGLVVVEFAVEDASEPGDRICASMEGIVRQIRTAHPQAEILFLYALAKDDLETFQKGELPVAIRCHEKIAEHYGIPSVNMAQSVASRVLAGEMAFEEFCKDGVHPTDKGHALYVDAVKPFIAECKASTKGTEGPATYKPPAPLSEQPMDKARMESYEKAVLETGWLGWQESPVERFFHVVRCDEPGPLMTLRFVGDTAGCFAAVGPDSGDIELSLNGGAWQLKRSFDEEAKTGYRPQALLLAEKLDPKATHELRLRVAAQSPEGSKGRWVRIAFFLVNGNAVYDDPYKGMTALQRIDAIYKTMPPVTYAPPADRWKFLPKTMKRLQEGGTLRIVMLGDSIVNDTASSEFEHLLMRMYPRCKVEKIRSVRGSTGCWWYKEENRVKEYVLDHKPDLLMIGGISQRNDVESIGEVIRQVRAAQDMEIMVMTGAFGSTDPRTDPKWTCDVDPMGDDYRSQLMRMAAKEKVEFLDMTGPWGRYILDTKSQALGSFKRDRVHANDRGKQILGRILERFFAPKEGR